MIRAWLPPALLAVYAVAFGWRALGGGLLVFDDHPGQLYRLAHAITLGLAPWRFNPGWWAGYAELQYYPPGFAWVGALVHLAAGGALDVAAVYQILLWLAWLLPGVAMYALLRRALDDPWLALPGAVVALTLSAGCRSGVEEGLSLGSDRRAPGLGVLPLLALGLLRWAEGAARPPVASAALVAAVILLHPAHARPPRCWSCWPPSRPPRAGFASPRPQSSSWPRSGWPRSGSSRFWRTCAWPCRWPGRTRPCPPSAFVSGRSPSCSRWRS